MGDNEQQAPTLDSVSSCASESLETHPTSSASREDSGIDSVSREASQKMDDSPLVPTHDSTDVNPDPTKAGTVKEAVSDAKCDVKREASNMPSLAGDMDSNLICAQKASREADATNDNSSQCDTGHEGTEVSPENPASSLDSCPTTPSTSGQDSGVSLVSPDDSSSDTAPGVSASKLPETSNNTSEESSTVAGLGEDLTLAQSAKSSEEKDLLPQAEASGSKATDDNSQMAAAAAAKGGASSDQVSVYYVKWVTFGANVVPIITQNENGPCPLLALMNVLLLKGKVSLAPMLEMVTSEQLMAYLADCIFENMPQNLPAVSKANYEQNMQDAMGVMDKLQTGLDVNVKFTGVGDFEYTRELIVFDLLEISLYHGWLVDPQDGSTVQAVNQCSYNQLVEMIISLKQSSTESDVTKGLIAEQFLDRTASQLTYHGLCELSSIVKDSELCVFFRNNHFNTLYKHNNELFLLVTDQGFLTEGNVVWETLSNVDGDGHFVDAAFRTYTRPPAPTNPIPDPSVPVGSPEQIDHDYQVALSLQEDDPPAPAAEWPEDSNAAMKADHEFALRLQEQENQRAAQEQWRVAPFGGQPGAGQAAQGQQGQSQQGRQQAPHSPPADSSSLRRRPAPERPDRREKEAKGCSIL